MARRVGILALAFFAICAGIAGNAGAQSCPPLSDYRKAVLTAEHLFGEFPSAGPVLVRRGYVTEYDAARRVPRWAAWRPAAAHRRPAQDAHGGDLGERRRAHLRQRAALLAEKGVPVETGEFSARAWRFVW